MGWGRTARGTTTSEGVVAGAGVGKGVGEELTVDSDGEGAVGVAEFGATVSPAVVNSPALPLGTSMAHPSEGEAPPPPPCTGVAASRHDGDSVVTDAVNEHGPVDARAAAARSSSPQPADGRPLHGGGSGATWSTTVSPC